MLGNLSLVIEDEVSWISHVLSKPARMFLQVSSVRQRVVINLVAINKLSGFVLLCVCCVLPISCCYSTAWSPGQHLIQECAPYLNRQGSVCRGWGTECVWALSSINIHWLVFASGFKLLGGKMMDLFSSFKFHHEPCLCCRVQVQTGVGWWYRERHLWTVYFFLNIVLLLLELHFIF